ncbi:MAG: GTP-binding protein [Candidatus Lokiarchaeota archaeon]|nr:GTP-binding protein [Candidatus Lokiarchaeota archaeon]
MVELSNKYIYKIIVVGDGGVGKTSLIKKFTEGSFEKEYIKTIGAQFSKYESERNGDRIKLLFWDIAGQEDFQFLLPSFYQNAKAAIIVYSLEENELGKNSFAHIKNWHENVLNFCGQIPLLVFANKLDLVNEANLDMIELQKLVNDNNFLGFYLTSAKTGKGVIEAFNAIIDRIYEHFNPKIFEI